MPSLSVVMIVRDEAHCIGACLESVRAIADEMVIGDTGSRDATPTLAAQLGARVLNIPWRDDFAAARNAVLAEAQGDWLLHMDADEVLDPISAGRIRGLVDDDGGGSDAFEVMLLNYCDDPRAWRWTPADAGSPEAREFSGYLPVPLLRLFRNHRGFAYREPVHENITASVLERGGKVRESGASIHHYGYAQQDADRRGAKAARYLVIARRKMQDHPDDVKALLDFAEQANACGLPEEAEAACRRALERDPDHAGVATTLANNLLNRAAFGEARALLERFCNQPQPLPHLLMALGALDCREGRLEDARLRLEASLRMNPRSPMAHMTLARVHDQLGAPDRARNELKLAAELTPGIEEFGHLLRAHALRREAESFFQAGHPELALEALVAALQLDPEDPLLHNDIGVVAHHLGDSAKARASFQRAMKLAPALQEARENLERLG